ncbi:MULTISPECIES: DUF2442 domain-containing protein [Nostocales]|uniref:DUF2442 domain-containing protein n=1 Tax=Nostocales TaxID=1161 RepID=UPI0021B12F5D|nr:MULTISPECIES: DUF2442 domain-containing protein [Nostocales]
MPQDNYQLYLKFEDGQKGIVNVNQFIEFTGVFEPLKDLDYFIRVKVNPEWSLDEYLTCGSNEAL